MYSVQCKMTYLFFFFEKDICDALQQNREQVAQANFEILTTEVGTGVKNNSSVDLDRTRARILYGEIKIMLN